MQSSSMQRPSIPSGSKASRPPRAPVGFFGAFALPFRTVGYLLLRPALWPLSAVPTLIFLLLWAGLFASLMALVEHLVSATLLAKINGWFTLPWFDLSQLIGGAIAGYTAYKATKVLSAVPLDLLGEKVEGLEGARPRPHAPWLSSVGRSFRVSVFGLALLVVGSWAIGTSVALMPPLALLAGPMQIALFAAAAAWDMLDYPYGRRHYGVRARLQTMRDHSAATLGFGCGYLILMAIPGMIFVAIVVGSVAATRLVLQNERAATT